MSAYKLLAKIRAYNSQAKEEFAKNKWSKKYTELTEDRDAEMRCISSKMDLENLTTLELIELVSYYSSFRPLQPHNFLTVVSMVNDRLKGE